MMVTVGEVKGSRIKNFIWFQRDPLGFLEAVRDIGDFASVRTSNLIPTYIVNSPEFIKEILVNKAHLFKKGRSSTILSRTVGEGLLTSEGMKHKSQRKMIQPAFYKEKFDAYSNLIQQITTEAILKWKNKDSIYIDKEMKKITLKVITSSMFGIKSTNNLDEISTAVDTVIKETAKNLFRPILIPTYLPTPGNIHYKHAVNILDEFIEEAIRNTSKAGVHHNEHLLSLLLHTVHGRQLNKEEIRDQLMTILIAGHETTANALTWTWYLLAKHPRVEEKMHAEINKLSSGDELNFQSTRELVYTSQIFQESLRLYPPAWIILRESLEEYNIGDTVFKKNSSFLISPFAIHRNPLFFDDPKEFIPERFENKMRPFTYFPFGGGPRGCVGSSFATLEAVLILALIGKSYKITLEDNVPQIKLEPSVSLQMKHPLKMKLLAR